jgi:ABC-type sugar transport system permease subunit
MAQTVLEAPVAPDPATPRSRVGGKSRDRGLVVLALPAVVWYVAFTIGPLFAMFFIAFMRWRGLNAPADFNGTDNFDKLFGDERILTALENTGIHLVGSLPIMLVGSFMLGYFINLKLPGHRLLRVIMFIPALISVSALGMLFVAVLGPTGLVNSALVEFDLGAGTAWLADTRTAMLCLIGITIWSGLGFTAILFAARLSAIDDEIYAAAELDGANHWQKMWQVAFPICRDYFGVVTMLQYLWTLFGSAGLILILTRGGPGQATSTLSWLVYDFGFRKSQVGYSQAVGLVCFVLGVVGLVLIRRAFRARY